MNKTDRMLAIVLELQRRRIGMADSAESRHSERTAAPCGLALVEGSWMLVAWCDLRQAIRHFRLSRMKDLIVLEDRFELPEDFDLKKYTPSDDRNIEVRLRFNLEAADRVKESGYPYLEEVEEHPNGLDAVLRVRRLDDPVSWVLGWGSDVLVLEPESLRARIREEAQRIVKRY
ncbi:WYL domain-containing protein [Paenibacillus glufosinatiresistens]|uniref:WYL domain-containing protein n=1 Tax=Paenibacillus glufosinatiresistens TaxID=3070657 RepID=UPI00286E53BE|nr:WYL domain-containing protein [Paenibacillus sp. YX.27]